MDWSKVKKEHVDQAIKKFIEEKPEHPEPRSYYLMYEGEKLPSKYIRGMAYSIATGEELTLSGFSGGEQRLSISLRNMAIQLNRYPMMILRTNTVLMMRSRLQQRY